MTPVQTLDVILSLYVWVAIAIILLFLFLIARFYEVKSGQRSFFWVFLVPLLLFSVASARRILNVSPNVGDWAVEAMIALAGMSLLIIGSYLVHLMTGGRK